VDISVPYRFVVEAASVAGGRLGDFALSGIDFEPAVQSAHLEGMRRGYLEPATAPGPARIEPVTCAERGAPYVSGFEVHFAGQCPGVTFPREILHDDVVCGSGTLVQQGLLRSGERFTYRICVFPEAIAPPAMADFVLETAAQPLLIPAVDLPQSHRVFGDDPDDRDLPVVIAEPVLAEAMQLAASSGSKEIGGMLLGGMCRDPASKNLFLNVSALIEAPASKATEVSLHLGPEAFAAVERILALRKLDENIVGWWHKHPFFCARCPAERRRVCAFRAPFFSEADRDVHRTLFPQAHSQALLITDLGEDRPSINLFAWRQGRIEARNFIQPVRSMRAQTGPEHVALAKEENPR
jgi:hypothetical protein